MRNHASSAFPTQQLYYRWRKTQVANYVIKSRVKAYNHEPNNELILSIPGRHHHSIQYSPNNSHWHIPIIDRINTWLCLSLEKTPKETIRRDNRVAEGKSIFQNREYEWQGDEDSSKLDWDVDSSGLDQLDTTTRSK